MTGTTTSERITAAAIELFHRQGYNATSLRQIAELCGLQVGSLYNHIASKEQLLFDIMRDVMVELIDYSEEAVAEAGDDPVERVWAFMRASIHFHAARQREAFIGNTELRGLDAGHRDEILGLRDRYAQSLRELLVEGRSTGALQVEDPNLATFAGIAICNSVARWYRPGGRLKLEQVEDVLPRMFGPLSAAR